MALVPSSSKGSGGGAISGVTVTGTAAAGDVPVASSSSAGVWALPPGYEFGYDQITAGVLIASTTEATGTTIITCAAHTFDGGPVLVTLSAALRTSTVATVHVISLFEGATQITELTGILLAVAAQDSFPLQAAYRFTPTAGPHTYTVTAFTNNSGGTQAQITAGAGGTGGNAPAFCRFTKV